MNELETLKMIPAYMIPAGLVLWMAYKVLVGKEATNTANTEAFLASSKATALEHSDQVKGLILHFWEAQEAWRKEVKFIVDDYVQVTRDVVGGLKAVEANVRDMKDQVIASRVEANARAHRSDARDMRTDQRNERVDARTARNDAALSLVSEGHG